MGDCSNFDNTVLSTPRLTETIRKRRVGHGREGGLCLWIGLYEGILVPSANPNMCKSSKYELMTTMNIHTKPTPLKLGNDITSKPGEHVTYTSAGWMPTTIALTSATPRNWSYILHKPRSLSEPRSPTASRRNYHS